MTKQLNVAVVGATGAVGTKMMEKLVERKFPIKSIKFLASARSAGNPIEFNGQTYTIEEATPESFEGIDVALFSAGALFRPCLRLKQQNVVPLLLIIRVISVWILKYR